MKKYMLCLAFLVTASLLFVGCSKDDDPADNDVFVGTYRGNVSYTKEGENKSSDNASVTVVKAGSDYNFAFSDGIPDLTGVRFRKDGDNTVISIDDDEAKDHKDHCQQFDDRLRKRWSCLDSELLEVKNEKFPLFKIVYL